ncbi:hypothetical protein [Novosphingobium terrae]|uniref:hypothetical protein n=1 Tax=Novosphingobium terrae TaxID=2726189 RepID=UPI00197D13F2|nr:hypothetical protein [Novosphingobium terrae]
MSNEIWLSSFRRNSEIGFKQGIRWRYSEGEWTKARHEIELSDLKFRDEVKRNASAYSVPDECFPKEVAVWDEEAFSEVGDVFYVAGFLAARGAFAKVLAECDLGDTKLLPFALKKADLITPAESGCYFVNLGSRKSTFVPEKSALRKNKYADRFLGEPIWELGFGASDGDITLKADALQGPDIWVEEKVSGAVFFSGEIVSKLSSLDVYADLMLSKCTVEGER